MNKDFSTKIPPLFIGILGMLAVLVGPLSGLVSEIIAGPPVFNRADQVFLFIMLFFFLSPWIVYVLIASQCKISLYGWIAAGALLFFLNIIGFHEIADLDAPENGVGLVVLSTLSLLYVIAAWLLVLTVSWLSSLYRKWRADKQPAPRR